MIGEFDMEEKPVLDNNSLALVIEDDEAHANLFSEALEGAGFEVEVFRDGKTGLSRLSDVMPTVVVLDINLPHVSGVDILRFIRSDARLAKTRVIIASANSQITATLHDVADLVLMKPVSYVQLCDLAARLRASKE
jgi:DNA-binding response OmpR family regulator